MEVEMVGLMIRQSETDGVINIQPVADDNPVRDWRSN